MLFTRRFVHVQIIAIHLSDAWNAHQRPSAALSSKLGFVAPILLRCYGVSEDDTRNRCSRLLNEILVSNCADEEGECRSQKCDHSRRRGVCVVFRAIADFAPGFGIPGIGGGLDQDVHAAVPNGSLGLEEVRF